MSNTTCGPVPTELSGLPEITPTLDGVCVLCLYFLYMFCRPLLKVPFFILFWANTMSFCLRLMTKCITLGTHLISSASFTTISSKRGFFFLVYHFLFFNEHVILSPGKRYFKQNKICQWETSAEINTY